MLLDVLVHQPRKDKIFDDNHCAKELKSKSMVLVGVASIVMNSSLIVAYSEYKWVDVIQLPNKVEEVCFAVKYLTFLSLTTSACQQWVWEPYIVVQTHCLCLYVLLFAHLDHDSPVVLPSCFQDYCSLQNKAGPPYKLLCTIKDAITMSLFKFCTKCPAENGHDIAWKRFWSTQHKAHSGEICLF